MSGIPHRKFPCNECPWRRDTPPGKFPEERYEALRATSGRPGDEAPLGAPMFACHKTNERDGGEEACAGWLAVEGGNHIGVRLAVATMKLPSSALAPGEGWPELFDDYDDMAETQAGW